uniref:Uncharacterized protein n=1 Tax=Arundo donax TaxID=35708 RepID=A0A0A8YN65_ARUDO
MAIKRQVHGVAQRCSTDQAEHMNCSLVKMRIEHWSICPSNCRNLLEIYLALHHSSSVT